MRTANPKSGTPPVRLEKVLTYLKYAERIVVATAALFAAVLSLWTHVSINRDPCADTFATIDSFKDIKSEFTIIGKGHFTDKCRNVVLVSHEKLYLVEDIVGTDESGRWWAAVKADPQAPTLRKNIQVFTTASPGDFNRDFKFASIPVVKASALSALYQLSRGN